MARGSLSESKDRLNGEGLYICCGAREVSINEVQIELKINLSSLLSLLGVFIQSGWFRCYLGVVSVSFPRVILCIVLALLGSNILTKEEASV